MHSKNSDHHCNLRFTDYSSSQCRVERIWLDLPMFWRDLWMTLGEKRTTDNYRYNINDMIWVCQ